MNSPNPPAPDPDELASALVDGLLSSEEAERARQDPGVRRRVEEILRVRSLVRDTPPPPAGAADQAVATALGAFEPARHLQVVERAKAIPLAERPRAGMPRWLAAAAVLVAVVAAAIGLGQLGGRGGDDLDTASEGGDESAETRAGDAYAEEESDDDSAENEAAAPEAPEGGAGSPSPDLGVVDDPDELRSRVESSFDGTARSPTADDAPTALDTATGCPDLSPTGDPQRGTSLFTASAVYRGVDVVVHVYDLDGAQRLVATDSTCADVVDVPYPGP